MRLLRKDQKATVGPTLLAEVQHTWSVGQEQTVSASLLMDAQPTSQRSCCHVATAQQQLKLGEPAHAGEGAGF